MFDYFGVLISVIFGLTLTHLPRGLGRIIQLRHGPIGSTSYGPSNVRFNFAASRY